MNKILRGQSVDFDELNKRLYIKINKPLGNSFSLSDKIVNRLKKGYTAIVSLPTKECIIQGSTGYIRKEERKSKFIDSPPYYLYWYNVKNERQIELW